MQTTQAYDLNNFAPQQKREREVRVVKNENRKALLRFKTRGVKMAALATVMLMLVCSLLYSQTMLTELTREIFVTKKDLVEAQSEYAYLSNEMELKSDIKTIEEKAAQLGLVKMDPSQVTYITITKENKIEIPKSDNVKSFEDFRTGLMSFMEYLAP